MRLTQELTVRPTQRLAMTPQLRQAIAALQLNVMELSAHVQTQVEANPMLELVEEDQPAEPDLPIRERGLEEEDREDRPEPPARAAGFAEQLAADLCLEMVDGELRRAAVYLSGNMDDDGYLRVSLEEAATDLGIGCGRVRQALAAIQALQPGIGARDLRECLALQLGEGDALVRAVVEGHLEDLGAGRLRKVAARLGVGVEAVAAAAEHIRRLDPRPGRPWAAGPPPSPIIPDIRFQRMGAQHAVLVEEPAPRVRLSLTYRRWLEGAGEGDAEVRHYLEERLQAAVWMLRCLEQRRLTLYRVGQAILEQQPDFFLRGIRCLRPMTMREVADAVGVHESTVSRVVANKHAATSHGMLPLRFFFSSGLGCSEGEPVSARSVKRMIRDLAQGENRLRPLSDRQLAAILQTRGVRVARRTVTKYRQEMGLAASAARRRFVTAN
ncbi:MAG TPA: RNA polymerase factor sigma-54 [Bacillota bacterium]|nr:RNA polymerase factor sigma-54 [Bacillota bacterium]